jgi:nucleoside triphosphate pyrophosphatase
MNFQTISKDYPLILASSSPRRKRLLKQIGIPFHALSSHVEEDLIAARSLIRPGDLAVKKAEAIHLDSHNNWILGADTVVVVGETFLGKPKDQEDAQSMLLQLSGREHKVITGFCLIDPHGKTAHTEEITTLVRVKKMTEQEIRGYIMTGEPFGKAGGYGIQGIGAFMVEAISGSYSNVVGLPLCALVRALCRTGALNAFPIPS